MVARNVAHFIDAALHSVLAQTLRQIEVVVVDDGSTDETAEIVRDHVGKDPRVRLMDGPRMGLSAVRNTSLAAARAPFVAIVDADDLLHPQHLEWLLEHQAATGAQICASNMASFFQSTDGVQAAAFAAAPRWRRARRITANEFVRCGMIGGREVSLGYFKPLLARAFLLENGIRYDEGLRIGEDFDLLFRAMLAGARFEFLPRISYFYRRHAQSTSHRLALDDLAGLIAATRGYSANEAGLAALLRARLANLEGARRQLLALDALRERRILDALRVAGPHREARRLVLSSLRESCIKRLGLWDAAQTGGDAQKRMPLSAADLVPLMRALSPAGALT
ncbi:hypothetical protein A8V01_01370 [Novosphingobium guangzhouense]|uniref:Glycosyltransferase 2-like domain-containing protein n=2 Tax=Novosphingobium guangzhouense TaxID=1850347 RepID=A0A2K2G749_9SPHN|nr:hypothetical protein A8V01_01370 [Novosphingobium guangzhouense]